MKILVAAEAAWVRDLVRTAFIGAGQEVIACDRGQAVRDLVATHAPDLVILDMQIANMGGIAVAIDLRLEAEAGRVPSTAIVLLLDREADRHLGRRADADEMLCKPVDAGVLRRCAQRLLTARADRPVWS
ncbi:MAG: response regulator [Acidimicrobiia bacterium]|jgi:DNA-binding response OmpR family regulator